jgi:hypothetical protein
MFARAKTWKARIGGAGTIVSLLSYMLFLLANNPGLQSSVLAKSLYTCHSEKSVLRIATTGEAIPISPE